MTNMKWFPVLLATGPGCLLPRIAGLGSGEQFQVTLPPEVSFVSGAFTPLANCRGNLVGHIWPVELLSHGVVHVKIAGVSC